MENSKKPFKKTIFGKILVGVGDAFTGGTVSNLVYQDENAPAGAIDWKRAGVSIGTVILIYAFAAGKISFTDLHNIILLLNN